MKFYFRFEMREYTFNTITGIYLDSDDWKKIMTDKKLIYVTNNTLVGLMKPWVHNTISECLWIECLRFKIFSILHSKFLKHPNESDLVSKNHLMSNMFEFTVGFSSWIFQKIPIYGCYLVCLAHLYGNWVETLYYSFYPISSINDCKMWSWISSIHHSSE